MVTEAVIYHSEEGETDKTIHNMEQLPEDYPNLFPDKCWTDNGFSIFLSSFYYHGQDEMGIHYCSHDRFAPEATLKFWVDQRPETGEIIRRLSYSTRLSESTDDSTIEAKVRQRLSISIVPDGGGKPNILLKNLNDEAEMIIPLTRTEDPQNNAYCFKCRDYEEDGTWAEIRGFLSNSLGYYIKELNVLYDRERRLEFNIILD